jgi:hypothetical protein
MAKNDSTGKSAKQGGAARAASGGSGAGTGATAKKSTAKKSAASQPGAGLGDGSPALEGGATAKRRSGAATADTQSGGAGARKSAAKKTAGTGGGQAGDGATAKKGGARKGAGAGLGDGSPALEGGATAKKSAAKKSAGAAGGGRDLRGELRDFARSRPDGWGHDDWMGLLGDLRGRGHDVSDEGAVGMQLERERLAHQLEGVDGLGKKADALVDRFETVYSLRQASVDDVAGVKGMDRQLAERVKERFR